MRVLVGCYLCQIFTAQHLPWALLRCLAVMCVHIRVAITDNFKWPQHWQVLPPQMLRKARQC